MTAHPNHLYFGDNLDILRQRIADESVDLTYLAPPFNSNATYNVLFRERSGEESAAQITSAGTLHFGLTAESLFETPESRLWNPLIAGAFYRCGIIETWGRGIRKMVELTTQAGLPNPEIEESIGFVTVTFRPSRYIPPQRVGHDLTERQRLILALINNAPYGLALREMFPHLEEGITRRQLQWDLEFLRSLNLILLEGRGYAAKWKLL